jgi:hypothetical protein
MSYNDRTSAVVLYICVLLICVMYCGVGFNLLALYLYWSFHHTGLLGYFLTHSLTHSLTHLLTHFLAHSLICYEKTRLDQWSSRTSRKWVPSVATRSTWKKWRDSRWQCCREGAARTLSHTHSRTHAFNALTNALTSHALTFFHSPKLFLMLSLTHHSCTP